MPEGLSVLSMGDVRVHYDTAKPSVLQSLVYTKGSDIHVGSGEGSHFSHEISHVVQKKAGRITSVTQTG